MFLVTSYIVMSHFADFMRFLCTHVLYYLTINIDILFIFNYVIQHIPALPARLPGKWTQFLKLFTTFENQIH